MTEADKNTKARHALEKTKMEAENKLERSSQDLQDLRERSALWRWLNKTAFNVSIEIV